MNDPRSREERADALLLWLAEKYLPPGSGGIIAVPQEAKGVPDPPKYIYPKALARLKKDVQDEWACAMVAQFWESSYYHFAAYGLARLLFAFPTAIAPHREALLTKAMAEEQLFAADGTENHIAMWRTSGYLFAQEANADKRLAMMTDWVKSYAKRLRENGQGEWDSSTYMTFDIAAWLNLLDYAKDGAVRAIAQEVVETFARQVARKYVQGTFAGAEKRGFSARSINTITGYTGWLWFGDVPLAVGESFFSQNAIYTIIPALSTYHPDDTIREMALRRNLTTSKMFRIPHPNYLMQRPAEAEEVLYVTLPFSVGSSIKSPIGGWGGGDTQETLWKFVARGTMESGGAFVIGGAGAGYATRNKYSGMGRSPWDQVWQQGNVVVQMTRVPKNAEELTSEAKALFDQWKQQGNREKVSWADPVPQSWAYTTLPTSAEIDERNGMLLVRMNGVFAGIRPLHGVYSEVPAAETRAGTERRIFRTEAGRGELAGWVYEFSDQSVTDWDDFIANFTLPERLRVNQLTVVYRPVLGDRVTVTFGTNGTYTEPEYDWGKQPKWPSGEGHGRVPRPGTG